MGFYIGTLLEHYCCFKCYVTTTGAIQKAHTVNFFPHKEPLPQVTIKDQFIQAINDILIILKINRTRLPFLEFIDSTKNAITTLATLPNHNLSPNLHHLFHKNDKKTYLTRKMLNPDINSRQ